MQCLLVSSLKIREDVFREIFSSKKYGSDIDGKDERFFEFLFIFFASSVAPLPAEKSAKNGLSLNPSPVGRDFAKNIFIMGKYCV